MDHEEEEDEKRQKSVMLKNFAYQTGNTTYGIM